jgi:hypothetical protein
MTAFTSMKQGSSAERGKKIDGKTSTPVNSCHGPIVESASCPTSKRYFQVCDEQNSILQNSSLASEQRFPHWSSAAP